MIRWIVILFCVFGSVAQAHVVGQSFEKHVGKYLIDAGCDQLEFIPKENNTCSFGLVKNPGSISWEPVRYDTVTVAIRAESGATFYGATAKGPERALTVYTPAFAFPHGGMFILSVRFQTGGKTVAETAFPLSVRMSDSWFTPRRIGAVIGMVILGGCALSLLLATVRKPR